MRTSILLDDELAERIREVARERGQSFSAFMVAAGRAALRATEGAVEEPFTLITHGEGGVLPGIDLDRSSELLVAEDLSRFGPR